LGNKIVGNKGKNTVIFSGDESNYTITKLGDGKYSISDNRDNGDGVVLLENIEKIKFTSSELDL
ncbi:putative lipo domain protein, partial [Vibrio parahaemolyticus 970107]